jgi:hypothetical protein
VCVLIEQRRVTVATILTHAKRVQNMLYFRRISALCAIFPFHHIGARKNIFSRRSSGWLRT